MEKGQSHIGFVIGVFVVLIISIILVFILMGSVSGPPSAPSSGYTTPSWCTAGETYADDMGNYGTIDGFYDFNGQRLCRATMVYDGESVYLYSNEDFSIWYMTDAYGRVIASFLDDTGETDSGRTVPGGGTQTPGGVTQETSVPSTAEIMDYDILTWCPAAKGLEFGDLREQPDGVMYAYEYTSNGLVEWNGRYWCENLAKDPDNPAYYVYQNEAGVVEFRQAADGTMLDWIPGAHDDYDYTLLISNSEGMTPTNDNRITISRGMKVSYYYQQPDVEYCGSDSPCTFYIKQDSDGPRPHIVFLRDDGAEIRIAPTEISCHEQYPVKICLEEATKRVSSAYGS